LVLFGVEQTADRITVVDLTAVHEVTAGSFPFKSQDAETVRTRARIRECWKVEERMSCRVFFVSSRGLQSRSIQRPAWVRAPLGRPLDSES
jgi:hypothetical protein